MSDEKEQKVEDQKEDKKSLYYGTKDSVNYGFYSSPENLKSYCEVSKEEHKNLMQGVCEGKLILPDENGKPILADQERDYLAEATFALEERKAELNRISVVEWAGMTKDKQSEWTTYLKALDAVPKQKGFPESIEWPVKPE